MKLVIIFDGTQPLGLLANACAVPAFSASKLVPDDVGEEVVDADGERHPSITRLPIPILACESKQLSAIRQEAVAWGLTCIDFSDVAQHARRYDEYTAALR